MTTVRRIGLGLILLVGSIVAVGIAGISLLNTNLAHRYILRLIIEHAQEAIHEPLEIGGLSFHPGRLGADFYRITIQGSEPTVGVPLFTADRVGIDVRLHLFQRRKLEIENVTLDHPAMHLLIGSKGNSNLPRLSRASGSSTSPFHLAIRHLALNQGELFYNDRRVPITADVRDLNAQALYDGLTKSYQATLSYRDARIQYASLRPFTHALEMSLTAGASGLRLKSLKMQTGSSWVKAQGQIRSYSALEINGSYEASLSTADLVNLFPPVPGGPRQSLTGRINTQGTMSYRKSDKKQAIDNLTVSGQLRGNSLAFQSSRFRVVTPSLAGEYALDQGTLEVRKVEADLFGGHVSGHLSISRLSSKAAARLEAGVAGLSLSNMQNALRLQKLADVRVRGLADGNVRATWNGSMKDVQLLLKASFTGMIAPPPGSAYGGSFPINGALQAAYDGDKQTVTLQGSQLNTPHGHLLLNGSFGNHDNLAIDAHSDDLHEVGLLILAFRPTSLVSQNNAGSTSQLLRVAGQGSFNGSVRGTLANPDIAGSLECANVRIGDTKVASLRAAIQASPSGFDARHSELRIGSQGRADFDVSIGLQNWDFVPDQPVTVRFTADRLSVSDLENIAGLQYPITGSVTANLNINGTRENPNAQGDIRLAQAELWHQQVKDLSIGLRSIGDSLEAKLHVQIPAGSANGTLRYDPKSETYDLQASSTEVQLNQVQYIQEHAQKVTGVIQVSVSGHGNTKSPRLDAKIDSPQLQIGQQKIDGLTAKASLAQQKAAFEMGTSISGANFRIQGTVDLTGDYEATASVDSQVIPLNSLLETFLPQAASDLHGSTQLHGTLKGPLKDPARLEAHVEVPSFQVGYASLQFALASPMHIDYQQGVLAVKRTEFKGSGTDLVLEGSVPLQSAGGLKATANGTVDLQLLQSMNRDWRSSGRLDLRIGAQGAPTNPQINGTAAVSNSSISVGSDVPTLEKINGEIDFTGKRVQIKTLTGQLGGGEFDVSGFATYRPNLQYNFVMKARKVRLLYPEGMRTQLTASINFTGQPSDSKLTGQVTIDRLSLTQSFDLASFASAFSAPSSPSTGMAQNIKLNVAVSSSQELQVASSQLSVQGTADLRVQGTLADPVVIGRANLTGGEVFFNTRRFQLQNASIQFANPVRTEPVINLTATTTVNEFNLNINLVGPLDRLRTTYTSDPPLPPVDVINLLITGKTTEAAQASSPTPLSVLAGQLGGQASNRLQKLTGISSLTIDPTIGGNQGNAGSQVAIQERVTKNLFFTFATDVTTTQGQIVQVEYQVTRRYSMSVIRDQTGGYEVQIKAHKTF